MFGDLSDLTVEEMLYLKDELNASFEKQIEQFNEWLMMCQALRAEMEARSAELSVLEDMAKKDREAEYSHMYEAHNNLH